MSEIRVFAKRGQHGGGTWGCKEAVIEFASYCSPEFRRAVRQSFNALTEGKPFEAMSKAQDVMVSEQAIKDLSTAYKALTQAIDTWSQDPDMKAPGSPYVNVWDCIIVNRVTDCPSTKDLKVRYKGKGLIQCMTTEPDLMGHIGGLTYHIGEVTQQLNNKMDWTNIRLANRRADLVTKQRERHAKREADEARQLASFRESLASGAEF